MAEKYFDDKNRDASVSVQHRQKTFECFARLPEEFSIDDVMRCFNLKSEGAARVRTKRLMDDRLAVKVVKTREENTHKARYRKTGTMML
jgi:hypothetical protein